MRDLSLNLPPRENLPRHVGIIMDGNGRWAKKRLLPRTAGHYEGAKRFREVAGYACDIGLECISFFAFSTENWARPKSEVDEIMRLFDKYLDDADSFAERNAILRFPGDISAFSEKIQAKIRRLTASSENNTGTAVCIAVNYGGRYDIVNAVNQLLRSREYNDITIDVAVTEAHISKHLYTAGLPDLDLVIRPSGEQRVSNFMLWQAAYAEFVFMDTLWPDFGEKQFNAAISEYAGRRRRFGKI